MKLGMSAAAFYGHMETEDAVSALRGFGLDTCEVFLETYSEYCGEFGALVRSRLGELPCVSVHPKGTQFEPDLFGLSVRQRRDAAALFGRVCDAGQAMGARYYVFHSASSVRVHRAPASLYRLTETMAALGEIAAKRGIRVLWENVSWCAMRSPEDVRQVRQLLPEQGFVLDLKQAHQAGYSPLEMLEAMGDGLCHLHVLDWDAAGALTLPGEGCFDFPALFHRLRAMQYTGAVILEPYGSQGGDRDRLARSLTFLRRAMEGEA